MYLRMLPHPYLLVYACGKRIAPPPPPDSLSGLSAPRQLENNAFCFYPFSLVLGVFLKLSEFFFPTCSPFFLFFVVDANATLLPNLYIFLFAMCCARVIKVNSCGSVKSAPAAGLIGEHPSQGQRGHRGSGGGRPYPSASEVTQTRLQRGERPCPGSRGRHASRRQRSAQCGGCIAHNAAQHARAGRGTQ